MDRDADAEREQATRAAAMVRTTSSGSRSGASARGVPGTLTSMLIGTDSGGGVWPASSLISRARMARDSPMPTMPPLHTEMPAPRTCCRVSRRSS